jgi:hypothetical protein
VPITNSLAFLFTVLGEWWAEKKVITKGKFYVRVYFGSFSNWLLLGTDTWIGMALVLGGIALCVHSKNT